MKIYFYSNNQNGKDALTISKYLKKVGIEFKDNFSDIDNVDNFAQDSALSKVDSLIVLTSNLSEKEIYLIALSLSQNKDVLCLIPQGKNVGNALKNLKDNDKFSDKLYVEKYQGNSLIEKVSIFLESLHKDDMKELFNIKYTLRVSSKINSYLNWKANQINMPKADWIRDIIRELMNSDQGYQDFDKNKFKVNE